MGRITDESRMVYGSDYPYILAPILLGRKKSLDEELASQGRINQVYIENAAVLLKETMIK